MKKSNLISLCVLLMLLSLTACGQKAKTVENVSKTDTESATELETSEEAPSDDTEESDADAEVSDALAETVSRIDPATVPVNAESDFVFEAGSDGTALITGYVGTATQVHVPDTLGGCTQIVIGKNSFMDNKQITYLYLPKSVIAINDTAFWECDSLKTVDLADSSVTKIGFEAFAYCDALTTLSLPATLKAGEENGLYGNIIYSTPMLTNLTLAPGGELELVDGVIYGDNTAVLGVPYLLDKTLTIRDGTEFIANYAFSDIDAFTTVNIPDSVLSIGEEAFMDNESIMTLNLGNGVKRIEKNAFNYCDNIQSFVLPQSLEYLGLAAFRTCNPKTVQLPDSFEMDGSIAEYVFLYAKDTIFTYRGQEYTWDQSDELTDAIKEN